MLKSTDVRNDQRLANILMAYTNPQYLAGEMIPTVPNLKDDSGDIPVLGESHLRIYDTRRAAHDESSHRMSFEISTDKTYKITYHDLDVYLPYQILNQARAPFDLRRDAAIALKEALMLERENALAELFTSTTAITQNVTLSGTSQWSDRVNSDPHGDVETGRTAIFNATGREPNSVYLNREVFNELKYHPAFTNRVSGIKVLTGSQLTQLIKDTWEVENVYVGKAIKVTSNEGQTVTKGKVWQNDVVLFYRAPKPSLYLPSFAYNFELAGKNMKSSNFEHHNKKGIIERVDWAYQDKILDTNAVYLIKSAV